MTGVPSEARQRSKQIAALARNAWHKQCPRNFQDLSVMFLQEKMLRENRDTRHSTHITELVTVRDKEKQLKFDLDQAREALKQERERVAHLMKQVRK